VLFGAVSLGGASTSPQSEYMETLLSASLVSLGGVGGLKPPELQKILAGRMASAGGFIDLSTEGIRGGARPQDLEVALQLMYLTFTAPNQNAETLALLKRQLSALVANRQQNPQAVFGDRVRALNTGNSYFVQPFTTAVVEQLRLDVMSRAYTSRFANAADFSFFLVGAFDPATVETLVTKYIASLPSTGRRASKDKPLDFVFPSKVETVKVEQGKEPKSDTIITFFSDTGGNLDEETLADGAAALLQMRLRDILREQLGGTYSVSTSYSNTLPSPGYATSAISFGSAPENAASLTAEVLKEISRLATEGPTEEDAQKVREQEKREFEEASKQNGYWLAGLQSLVTTGRDPAIMATRGARIDSLTPARLKEAFVKYYPMNRHTVATLLPAPKPAEPQK
jgi:zinc protease